MRILLTGSSGQIGNAVLPFLRTLGTVISPSSSEFDLGKPQSLESKLDEFNPDLIINPAAYTAVDRAEDDRERAFLVNAIGPGTMALWAARRIVPMIHFSTDYLFGGSGVAPRREDDPPSPLSVYGTTKLAGDNAILGAGGPHLIIRTSWVYAANGANFLKTIARLASEREELRIVSDQIGAPTSACAIATAVEQILSGNTARGGYPFAKKFGVLNVVCEGETSWCGFAGSIVEGLRRRGQTLRVARIVPIRTDEYPVKARRPANSRLDLSRLHRDFGIRMPTWEEALERELDEMTPIPVRQPVAREIGNGRAASSPG